MDGGYFKANMKIAYLVYGWNIFEISGVMKKIFWQIEEWQEKGHEVKLFAVFQGENSRKITPPCECEVFIFSSMVNSFGRLVYERVIEFGKLSQTIMNWNPDILYFRQDIYYTAWEQLMKRIPTVIEINTDDVQEFKHKSWIFNYYNRLTRSRLLKNAAGLVYVTGGLSERAYFSVFKKPSIIISNGIKLSDIDVLPDPENSVPRLTFIGSPSMPWHGLDKILLMAKLLPDFKFDIIGSEDTMVERPPNVKFYGFLQYDEYINILAKTDVAIGSLAIHRAGLSEASPLKVREYLAMGIPIIIAYHDTDFPDQYDFIYQLPNEENNIEPYIDSIKRFVLVSKNKRVSRNDIRHLDCPVKETIRLAFFNEILEKSRIH